ncbi:MAG: acylphosphatase [Bacteroidota bacterium]|nr:acylphosphatase [Bacteroidota bacterium]
MKKHFTIRVSGLVQGVFFRASTKQKADSLNITGFVRNEHDGSVYIEAEGNEEDLKQFVQWCHHGPPNARVEQCDIRDREISGYPMFEIRR